MVNDSSFLFVGIHFHIKKFGVDIANVKTIEPLEEEKGATSTMKKRKRKGTSSGNLHSLTTLCYLLHSMLCISLLLHFRKHTKETVEGFNVFRSSTSVAQSNDEESVELYNNKKKEQNKKLERDTIFRKQHNIHVSGYNVSSLLQHNISEKSPGPSNNNLTVLNNFNGRDLLGIKR
ncbi:DEAD-box ATP-dependent RNA helicase 57 [Glycine max]|nr:DEAD-box ATP-dependent RNA helicase 57 [Glycine max]